MVRPIVLLASLALAAGAPALAQNPISLASLSAYGNLQAGGVVALVSGDANLNASASLEWRPAGGAWTFAHPLVRIDATHFVGSLFWLSAGTAYEVRVTLADPDGVSGSPAVAALTTRPDTLPPASVRTLYVATTGNDANPGTNPAAPLRTVQHAADISQPGDLISIQPGIYRESVSVTTSGTASQPIVFRGVTGAILDGADAAIATGAVSWSPAGGGVYALVTGFATDHVVTEAGRLYRYGTLAALQALGAGAPGGFFFDGATLRVRFPDNSSPASHTMHVARLEDGFYLDGVSNVRIENMEIRHYGSGGYGKGVYLRYSADCVVRTSKIHEVESAGVWIKGGDRHRVEDNEIWDTSIFNWPWDLTKGSSAENNAVVLTDDVGRGNVIRRNTIHGQFNGMGPCGSTAPPGAFTTETDIYENTLYQHTDDALEPEGWCSNVRIWRNTIRDVHMAFAVAPANPGPVFFVRNVAWRVGNTRTSQTDGWTASALKINSGYPEPVGPVLLFHNTLLTDAPNTDAVVLMDPGSATWIWLRNNVIAGTRYVLDKVNPVPWYGDWNDVYTTDASRLVRWMGTRYNTLAAYQAATGQEPSGLSAPPQLVNPAGGDFRPAAGSPLIDRGVFVPGMSDGFLGAAPDIGALEHDPVPVELQGFTIE